MAITIEKGFNWTNGATVMPSRLNTAQTGIVINCATGVLIGRTTAGGGTIEEITPGAGLVASAGGLSVGWLDTNSSHRMRIACGSDITADRTITFAGGDSDRTITLSGNPTLADWFDQSVKTTASPTFAGLSTGSGAISGGAASFTTLGATGVATFSSPAYPNIHVTSTSTNSAAIKFTNSNTATVWLIGNEGGAYNTAGTLNFGIDGVGSKMLLSSSALAATVPLSSTVANNVLTLRSSAGNATNKLSLGTTGEYGLINYDDTTGYMTIGQPAGRNYGTNIITNGSTVATFTSAGVAMTGTGSTTNTFSAPDLMLTGTDAYINMNATAGSGGYGIRNNAGTMEFKNNGGSWQGISAGGGGGTITGTPGGTDNRICRADGTGTAIQGSAVTIDDSGNITGAATYDAGTGGYKVSGTKVLGAQSSAEADFALTTGGFTSDAATHGANYGALNGKLNSILGKLRTHGIFAT